ncbi:MAG: DNA-binding protein [Planctomycetota bacterium]|nr:MAG: DNA-binding protein [Planctomycetota bacterium]
MSSFIPLDEAAKRLGVTTDELVEMRSRGEIFGYRDGGSWKFKPEEIDRVLAERQGDALDEVASGSSLGLGPDEGGSAAQSDVALVADGGEGSDVRLVASDDDEEELALSVDDGDDLLAAAGSDAKSSLGSDLELASGSGVGSDVPLSGSDEFDLKLSDGSNILSGSDISLGSDVGQGSDAAMIKGDSDPVAGSDLNLEGSDLQLDDDDLNLADDSDLALGSDSGINLMSPSDSGISLEDEPLDLAASGISGLDLAGEGSDVAVEAGGSGVDFQQDEEFQLSPSGSLDADDDSGSQVIELEDSSEFGDEAVAVSDAGGLEAIEDLEGGGGLDAEDELAAAPAAIPAAPGATYGLVEVLMLLGILLIMCLSGILVSDIARNMWAWAGGEDALTSGFGQMVTSIINK